MKRSTLIGLVGIAVASVALLIHARTFDFFCDDALITLRYSRNLALHGSPVYNPGARVEGYTSPLFMVLVALGIKLGMSPESAAHLLGAASGVGILAGTWLLWRRIEPTKPWVGVLVLAGIAASAPVAAWTLGGLEAPLFGALVTITVVVACRVVVRKGFFAGAGVGVLLALTTLARPEGAAMAVVVVLVAFALERKGGWTTLLGIVLGYFILIGPFEEWRWRYYGYPLPNTFYVKTQGGQELLEKGIKYIQLLLFDTGEPLTQILLIALFIPSRSLPFDPDQRSRTRRAALWMCRGFTLIIVPYVASVGGDFLDLYRFFVPIFPLVFAGAAHGLVRVASTWRPGRPRWIAAVCLLAITLAPFAWRQQMVGKVARRESDKRRANVGIETIGWTREYALRWSATGRWIAAHAKPTDWMATGAAGAMPFYAGINNLDILGLCDEWVAHNGNVLGTRPGHQREAPESYFLSKRPVFLMFHDHMEDKFELPKRDADWERKGYVWVVATVDAEKYGAPKTFYHVFLMRIDRAGQLIGADDIQTALGMPE
jgi:arabinofuranosyltransferase